MLLIGARKIFKSCGLHCESLRLHKNLQDFPSDSLVAQFVGIRSTISKNTMFVFSLCAAKIEAVKPCNVTAHCLEHTSRKYLRHTAKAKRWRPVISCCEILEGAACRCGAFFFNHILTSWNLMTTLISLIVFSCKCRFLHSVKTRRHSTLRLGPLTPSLAEILTKSTFLWFESVCGFRVFSSFNG
jgi:hypothetical protein